MVASCFAFLYSTASRKSAREGDQRAKRAVMLACIIFCKRLSVAFRKSVLNSEVKEVTGCIVLMTVIRGNPLG